MHSKFKINEKCKVKCYGFSGDNEMDEGSSEFCNRCGNIKIQGSCYTEENKLFDHVNMAWDSYNKNMERLKNKDKLLKNERLLIVVDKPLIRILPELHQDNDEYLLNNKIIPTSAKNNFIHEKTNNLKNNHLKEAFNL